MSLLITRPKEMTPTRLTTLLRERALLKGGEVSDIRVTHADSDNFADEYILHLTYKGTVDSSIPQALLLRISFPGKGWPNEPWFINNIVPVMAGRWPDRPLPFVTYSNSRSREKSPKFSYKNEPILGFYL